MADDLLITPGSRKLEIKDSSGNIDAKIETDASGNLLITNAGGDISIGDTSSDVFIGDGTNNVDIVFEQDGEIRGTSGVTLTLGASGSNVVMGTDLSLGGNDLTNVNDLTITGNLTITGDINSYNVTDLDVTDKTITLGVGQTEANSGNSGIIIDGSSASMLWDESNDRFSFNKGISVSGNISTSADILLPYGSINDSGTDLVIHGTNAVVLKTDGGTALTIPNNSINATFGGNVTTSGFITTQRIVGTQSNGSSLYALELTRSSTGVTTPDLYGTNSTLVLGVSSSDEVLGMSSTYARFYKEIQYSPDTGNDILIGNDGTYGTSGSGRYVGIGFGGKTNGSNRVFAHNTGADGLYLAAATGRGVAIRTNGSGSNTYFFGSGGEMQRNGANIISSTGTFIGTTGFSSDTSQTGRMYSWKPVTNTSSSGSVYIKIATLTISQSARFSIELIGRSTSYSDGNFPSYGKLVGQLNNDNNVDCVFYDFKSGQNSDASQVITDIFTKYISNTSHEVWVNVGSFSELGAFGYVSTGSITPHTANTGSTTSQPSGMTTVTKLEMWNSNNDGPGSGLNADTLDGVTAANFLRSNENDTASGDITITGSTTKALTVGNGSVRREIKINSNTWPEVTFYNNSTENVRIGSAQTSSTYNTTEGDFYVYAPSTNKMNLIVPEDGGSFTRYNGAYTVWDSGNDGSGSGLDADLLDGQHGSYYRNASNLNSGTIPDARLGSSVWYRQSDISVSSTNPFDNSLTATRVTDYGSYKISYTGASAHMISSAVGGSASIFQIGAHYNGDDFYMRVRTDSSSWKNWRKLWHDNNDGSGSGLDADKLDGQQGSHYLNYNNFTNTPTIPTNNNQLTNGAGYITSSGNTSGTAGGLSGTPNISVGTATATTVKVEQTSPSIALKDTGNAGGGGARGIITFGNTSGEAMGLGYTDNVTADSDFIISSNAGGTYGGYLGLDANAITDAQSDIILEPKTNVRIATGSIEMGTTVFVDQSRNITAGTITSSGSLTITGTDKQVKFTGTGGPYGLEFGDTEAIPNFRVYYRTTPNTLTFEDNSENAKHTFDLSGNYTATGDITSNGNLHAGDGTNISMDSSANGQLEIDGNGYQGAIALDGNAMHIYHNSSGRNLVFGTNETARLTINAGGTMTFHSNNLQSIGTISSGAITSTGDVEGVHIDVTAGNFNGLRFWNGSDSYRISMSAQNATGAGRVPGESTSDYNTYYKMDGGTNRGHVFQSGTTNTAGIDSTGHIRTIGNLTVGSDNAGDNFIRIGKVATGTAGLILTNGGNDKIKFLEDSDEALVVYVNNSTLAYKIPETGHIYTADGKDLYLYHSSQTSGGSVHMPRSGMITFYGDTSTHHAIGSRNQAMGEADDLMISSYGAVYIDLDSNNNNGSGADFRIGRHNTSSGTDSHLFGVSGENGTISQNSLDIMTQSSGTLTIGDITDNDEIVNVVIKSYSGTSQVSLGDSEMTLSGDVYITENLRHSGDANTRIQFTGDRIRMYSGNLEMLDLVEGTTDYVDIIDRVRVTSGGDMICEGDVVAFTSTTVSDINQKENIEVIADPLEKVLKLKGVTFDWKKDRTKSAGIIAQDVEKVLPEIVKEKGDRSGEEFKSVDYNGITGLLVEALKEQQTIINRLEDRIRALEMEKE